ncbi:hypothetical protein JT06_02475 [Desulfobulbus sp. Tol-SR]|jgi:hypothetical protein|nr:hypothetical protein JT06_02475 [Desulfobulbus sp. Tol-SR]
MKHGGRFFSAFLCAIFLLPSLGLASHSSGQIYFSPEEIIGFSKKVEKVMAAKGARVALVARVGRPREKLPEGISWTHTGIAVYSLITTADGRQLPGYAMYNLYQRSKEPDKSDLIMDYPVDFFGAVEVLEAGIVIPTPELQKRILQVMSSETYKKIHNPHYSVIANPYTLDYQNCTEHTLDIVFAAIYHTDDIKQIKANEKAYFEAQRVNVNPIKLAFGSIFAADVTVSDHPGQPVTATFESISRFLQKFGAVSESFTVTPTN